MLDSLDLPRRSHPAIDEWAEFIAAPFTGLSAVQFLAPIGLAALVNARDPRGVDIPCRRITWPDRLPAMVTWAGRMNLATIVKARQEGLGDVHPLDHVLSIGGASGLDNRSAVTADEAGFSLNGRLVHTYAGQELLAIIALETLPLVSLGLKRVGVLYGGRLWAWDVEPRGGYYTRFGDVHMEGL